MRCLICESSDWENVDQFRLKPSGMEICKNCGFVSYPKLYKTKEEIREYYRKEYRPGPSVNNLYTGTRKLHYHHSFLAEVFEDWKKKEGFKPKVFESGAAYGIFLNWVHNMVGAEVDGTEWTQSYKNVAFHEFGLKLGDEFDPTIKRDLIASYKVLEHQADADKELLAFREGLNDDGLLYISVPTWFNNMTNFGAAGWSIEYYYSLNHINVWTRKHFEGLLGKCGFEIIKQDNEMYDDTYLCKKGDFKEPVICDPAEIKDKMMKIFEADELYAKSEFDKAIEAFPNFPHCHLHRFEVNKRNWHPKGFDWIKENILDKALSDCPDSFEMKLLAGDVHLRYEKLNEATQYLNACLEQRPMSPNALALISNCFRVLADKTDDDEEKVKALKEAMKFSRLLRDTSLQHQQDAINSIYKDAAMIPIIS